MKVLHVITNLDAGGAQVMLARLVARLDGAGISNHVVSLAGPSGRGGTLVVPGAPVTHLGMRPHAGSAVAIGRLRRLITASGADVVQTWLYHADLVGGIAARLGRRVPVVWGIHHTTDARERSKRSTRLVVRANARLSAWVPDRIVCCAHAARNAHEAIGYAAAKMIVIPNGFDTDQFRPDPGARASVRDELGLSPETHLVTMAARFHPHKDHVTFVRAAARLAAERPAVRFLLAGDGVDSTNATLGAAIAEAGITGRVHLLGGRSDIARLLAASDVASLASTSTEALPLVLGEAMACGVPCVATDVGDCARLIGDTGRVVPPLDPDALARAWRGILALDQQGRTALGLRARQRVASTYSLTACAAAYADVYAEVHRAARDRRM